MPKITDILFIDDEQVILDFGIKITRFLGYSADTALDAETALDKLAKGKYKLIISDIKLPGIDGISLLEKIRMNGIKTPVIMSTGYSTFENAVLSLSKGALDFITKPFTADELISAITRGFRFIDIIGTNETGTENKKFVPCPSGYLRLGFYSWINKSEDETFLIGISDLFFKIIDGFEKIEFRNTGDVLEQGKSMLRFIIDESVYHEILAPLSGKIVAVNNVQYDKYVIHDPYFSGWIYKIIPDSFQKELTYLKDCNEY